MNFKLEFDIKFGHVAKDHGGIFCYMTNDAIYNETDEAYFFSSNITEEKIESLMKKSLADDHDYIFDFVKDNPCPKYDGSVVE